jgi:hypothetical protein
VTTLAHYTALLNTVGEPFAVLPLSGDASLLITQRGGRVLGLFPTPESPNLFWTSSAFDSPDAWHAFINRADGWHWNLGGDRVWIAPEITYNVRDRRDFGGTWDIPRAMDPGSYTLTESDRGIGLTAAMRLQGYHHGSPTDSANVRLIRRIESTRPPLADLDSTVLTFGYDQLAVLERLDDQPQPLSEVWNLVQLNAGGTLIIPVIGEARASDYVKPVPAFARQVVNGALHLPLNGQQQFKIGYKALCMTGRMGYLHDLPDGRAYLLVRQFFNDPSNLYAEEPPEEPGNTGHSVHVYNDGGAVDQGRPFCEMECSGHTLGFNNTFVKRGSDHHTFSLWAYVGAREAVREIARQLLGSAP